MLTLLSPAKSLDFESENKLKIHTNFPFEKESKQVLAKLKKLSKKKLKSLMKISDSLVELNYQRNQDHASQYTVDNSRQAILAFTGDVYQGLDVSTLNDEDIAFAQEHLMILSGLYGILRPLDLIQPYRLEMGKTLPVYRSKNLYEFWKPKLSNYVNTEIRGSKALINLASKEYFKAIDRKKIDFPIIDFDFREERDGQLKFISFNTKKARGLVARYIIKNKLDHPEDIKSFDLEGYSFDTDQSTDSLYTFTR